MAVQLLLRNSLACYCLRSQRPHSQIRLLLMGSTTAVLIAVSLLLVVEVFKSLIVAAAKSL